MATRPQTRIVTVEDYLAGEDGSDIRHEDISAGGRRTRTFDDPETVLGLPCAALKLALAAVYEYRS